MARTLSAQGSSTGLPHSSTTAVLGLAPATASTRALWPAGRPMWGRSNPSDSNRSGSPTKTTAEEALLAAWTAWSSSSREVSPFSPHPGTKGISGQASVGCVSRHGSMRLLPEPWYRMSPAIWPMNTTGDFSSRGSRSPSFFSSTALSAAARRARAWWASMSAAGAVRRVFTARSISARTRRALRSRSAPSRAPVSAARRQAPAI